MCLCIFVCFCECVLVGSAPQSNWVFKELLSFKRIVVCACLCEWGMVGGYHFHGVCVCVSVFPYKYTIVCICTLYNFVPIAHNLNDLHSYFKSNCHTLPFCFFSLHISAVSFTQNGSNASLQTCMFIKTHNSNLNYDHNLTILGCFRVAILKSHMFSVWGECAIFVAPWFECHSCYDLATGTC